MFEDSLLNGSQTIPTRRTATTMLSLGLETVLLATLIALPLFTTEGIPMHRWVATPVPLSATPSGQQQRHQSREQRSSRVTATVSSESVVRTPARIPPRINVTPEPEIPRSYFGVPGGDPNGRSDGMLNSILSPAAGPPPPTPAPTAPRRLLISHFDPGMLIRRVTPLYPHAALITRTEGAVVLRAVVGKDGSVKDLRVISGNPFLSGAAVDAVRRWQFKPYVLNGAAIEIETQVTVNFVLNR